MSSKGDEVVGVERAAQRRRAIVLDLWPALLAVVLCLPLLTRSGYPLARDLVFVAQQPWTDASLGLGSAAPRAVPLDAIVSSLTHLIDGGALARIVIPLILAVAGWGVHRLVRDLGTLGRLSAGGFAVWNPYVVERLALGQWALLAGYAALPWILVAARRFRESGRGVDLAATTGWLGLASITPTGGVLGSLAVLFGGASRSGRTGILVVICLFLQLPWVVPSILGSAAATSDPAGVDAFSAGAEGPGGVLTALIGLGGIWDANSVPTTRDSWWAPVSAAVVVLAIVLAWRTLGRVLGRSDRGRLGAFAGLGLMLAFASSLPGGDVVLEWMVETIPGAGLLRDSHKFLAPLVVLAAVSIGALAHRLVRSVAHHGAEVVVAVGLLAAPLPLMLLPDATASTWETLDPVDYPPGFERVAAVIDAAHSQGDLATLPWRSYRGFSWGNGLISSDPAIRWFDLDVVASDDLRVSRTVIRGENLRGRAIGEALEQQSVAQALGANGVTWALVYRDDPDVDDLDLDGLIEEYADDDLALYRVPVVTPAPSDVSTAERLAVSIIDGLVLALVLAAITVLVLSAMRRFAKSTQTAAR